MAVQITLKRADANAKALLKDANETKLEASLELSIYAPTMTGTSADVLDTLAKRVKDKLLQEHELSIDKIAAAYVIRALLGDKNLQCGVSPRLNRLNRLTAEEARLRKLLALCDSDDGEKDAQTALTKAAAMRESPKSERRGFMGVEMDKIKLSVLSDADVETWRSQLRVIVDSKRQLNDEITALNVTNYITLDDTTVSTLRRAGLMSA